MNRLGKPPALTHHYHAQCETCGQEAAEPISARCPGCAGLWKFIYSSEQRSPMAVPKGMWQFADLLPVRDSTQAVSLGEGGTPLVPSIAGAGCMLSYKLECLNPTGSQKDRAVSVAISKARELGVRRVLTASTGSSGLACAAYSARAGIACVVLVPEGTPPSRIAAMALLGAHVVEVEGNFSETYQLVDRLTKAPGWYLAATNRRSNPYQAEGSKTIAYEIIAQAGRAPDWIVVPVGGGGTISGIWRGLCDLHRRGLIDRLPRLAGAYATRVDRFARAYAADLRTDDGLQALSWAASEDTAMYNLKSGKRSDLADAVAAVHQSGGRPIPIEEHESLLWQRRLAREEGLVVEPSAAAASAAVCKLITEGAVGPNQHVVAVITGSGFRDPMPTNLPTPLRISPTAEAAVVDHWIENTARH